MTLSAPAQIHVIVKAPTREAAKKWADDEGNTFVSNYAEPHFEREDDFLDTDGTKTDMVQLMRKNAKGKPEVEVDKEGEEI